MIITKKNLELLIADARAKQQAEDYQHEQQDRERRDMWAQIWKLEERVAKLEHVGNEDDELRIPNAVRRI